MERRPLKRIVITGAQGLIGWHACVLLHAHNCAAKYNGGELLYDIVRVDHTKFNDDHALTNAVENADAILHFAGVNRGTDQDIAVENPKIASRLIEFCTRVGANPHIVYANSVHSSKDTIYGNSKRKAGEVLDNFTSRYTDLILPHVFGECARPFYNSVTATFIQQIVAGKEVSVDPEGHVQLLYAGDAVRFAMTAVSSNAVGQIQPPFYPISVSGLFEKLRGFHEDYQANVFPDLSDAFDLALFNTYRAATYPDQWPRRLQINADKRGKLFEAFKGGGGGQTFVSTTKCGVTRGNHFHLGKVERFLVIRGDAIIRIRKVLSDQIWEYRVSGVEPTPVDIPTLHTHSIENIGDDELVTLFWTHDLFDPMNPDTFADEVL